MADTKLKLFTGALDAPQTGGLQPFSGVLDGEEPSRTLGGMVGDAAVTAVKGAVGLPQAAVGLLDIPTGGRVGKALEGAGLRFKDAQDALSEMYSPAQQAANRKVQEAEGFAGTGKAMLENPSTIATGIGESLPQMLGGAGVARGIMTAAPRIGAVTAAALGEGVISAGSAAEQVREQTDDGLLTPKQAALAGASGAATAALGGVGGKVAQRLGIGDVDTMLTQGAARTAGQASTHSMPRQIAQGALAEGVLEEMPQSMSEQALQNIALERELSEGVGAAAAQGLITGTAMGGAGGAVGAAGASRQRGGAPISEGVAARQAAEAAAADAQAKADAAAPQWSTDLGAADSSVLASTGAAANSNAPRVAEADFETLPGAAADYGNTIDFQRDFDTGGLELASEDQTPSQRMGLDSRDGSMSAAAVVAVDSGAHAQIQEAENTQAAIEEEAAIAKVQQDRAREDAKQARKQPAAGQAIDQETGEIASGMASWSDADLSAAFRGAQSREVRLQLAQELQRRRAARERQALRDELDAEQAGSVPGAEGADTAFASVTEDAGAFSAPEATTTEGQTNGAQADQAQQAVAQPAQARGAQAAGPTRGGSRTQAPAGAPAPGTLNDGTATANSGAQAAPAAGAQEQAQGGQVEALRQQLRDVEARIIAAAPDAMGQGGGDIDAAMKSRKVPVTLKVQRKKLMDQVRAAASRTVAPAPEQAVAVAAEQAATSAANELPEPSEAQKEAGNYRKGHVRLNGLDISIENPAGSRRRPEWPPLQNHYGYFKGSVGADKDHVDVFMTDRAHESDLPVFVVDQLNKDGSFDEHKVVLGAVNEADARSTYLGNYSKGWTGLGGITQMTQDEFKAWVRDPVKTKKPAARGQEREQADRDLFTVERLNEATGRMERVTFSRGETVKVAVGQKPYQTGVITGISHAEGKFKVDGRDSGIDFGYAYPATYDEFAQPRADVDKALDGLAQRLEAGNAIEAQALIDGAKGVIRQHGLGDYAKDRIAELSAKAASITRSVADKVRASRERKAAEDAARRAEEVAAKTADPVRMSMEEWKATHKDFKSIVDGARMVLRDGGMRPVVIDKPKSVPQKVKEAQAARADYFTPGNIVKSYGGHDRVIAYAPPGEDGRWSVTVRAVEKQGATWVDKAGEHERVHGTQPDARELKAGPVERAPAEQAQRFEAGKALTKEERKTVLSSLVDVYKAKGAPRELKGIGRDGNERSGYVYSPELFEKSDITGAMVRYFVTLPDGRRAHPTELFPEYTQADIDTELARQQAQERNNASEAARVTEARLQFASREEAESYWDERSANSVSPMTGARTIYGSLDRTLLTNGKKFVMVPDSTMKLPGMPEALLQSGWTVSKPAAAASVSHPNTEITPQSNAGAASASPAPAPTQPASKTPTLDAHVDLLKRVRAGEATAEEFKAGFAQMDAGHDALLAELGTMKKDQLLKAGGYSFFMRYRNDKKGDIVAALASRVLDEYALGRSYGPSSYVMSAAGLAAHRKAQDAALRELVENTTDEDIQKHAQEVAAARAEAAGRKAAQAKTLANPETLADFRAVMRHYIGEGDSRQEAFLRLSPEQRARYDALEAESTKDAREAAKAQQRAQVSAAGQLTTGQVIETKHTKHGHDLFVVQLAERVGREDYDTLNASARRMGGSYSSYRGNGAVPGFQFRTRDAAEAFGKLVAGDAADAQAVAQARRDAFDDDRSQTATQRLRAMAQALRERADESLGRERKANTDRRARMAASAEAAARADKALAGTMQNLAQAIEDGKTKFLDAVRQKAQVEFLAGELRNAKDAQVRAKYPTYAEQERHRGEPVDAETVDFSNFPSYTAMRSDLAALARQMLEVDGTKKLGARLMTVADDVSEAYTDWAKQNLLQVSRFGRAGEMADFGSREDAERAIRRSGIADKAIVLPIKRGQNRVVLAPSEAMKQGLWAGDGDKRITLTGEFGAELVEAVGRRANGEIRLPWVLESAHDKRKRLAGMGILTGSEYRSALREFAGIQEAIATPDKIKEMERAMIGRRADGLDFFPTSAEVVDSMLAAAEIGEGMAVLEPSAGMGHIADAIREQAGVEPDVVELSGERRELLEAKGYTPVGSDFMDLQPRTGFTYGDVFRDTDGTLGVMRGSGGMGSGRVGFQPLAADGQPDARVARWVDREALVGVERRASDSGYDRIVMNPPFSKGRDIQHVMHAYELLRPGGRLVALMGEGAFFHSNNAAENFRAWLDERGATTEKLPDGAFMDPALPVNTGANARMVVIDKPAGAEQGSPADGGSDPDIAGFGQRHGSSIGTPTDRAVMDMAREGRAAPDILRMIAGTSRSRFHRQVARLLLKTGAAPAVSLEQADLGRSDGFTFLAKYSRKHDAISLTPGAQAQAEQIFLHEAIHAATLRALDRKGLASLQMRRLYEHVKRQGGAAGHYGMKNVGEFVAEAFTNPEFQRALRGMDAPSGSALKTAWDGFVRILRSILGLPQDGHDALSRALELGVAVMREDMALQGRRHRAGGDAYMADELRGLAQAARSTGNENTTVVLGKLSGQEVALLQREGIAVAEGFSHAADMFAVRHALNRHSDAKVESSRGQIALTDDDVARIADAVGDPTAYVLGGKTPRGQDVVGTIKRLEDGTLLYLEEVRTGRKTLAMTSMRKYPGTTDFDTIANSVLPSNARSDTGAVRIVYPGGPGGQALDGAGGDAFYGAADLGRIKASAIDQIQQAFQHEGKVSLWDKSVGTMRHLAERNSFFKPVYESAQSSIDDVAMLANDAADQAPRLLPRVETLADLRKKPITAADNKAVAKPLFEGTLMWARDVDGTPMLSDDMAAKYSGLGADQKAQMLLRAGKLDEQVLNMWRGLPLSQFESAVNSRFDAKMLKAGVVWTDAELRSMFKATPEQISLYREARAAIDRSIDMTARADMLRALGEEYGGVREAVLAQPTLDGAAQMMIEVLEQDARSKPDARDRLAMLMTQIRKRLDVAGDLQKSGYAPLSRFGRYTVDVVDANGERVYFGMYESKRDSNIARIKLAQGFPGATITQGTLSEQSYKLFAGVTPETLEQFGEMLGLKASGNEAQDKAFQEYLKLTKNNHSALRRLIHRKGIAGYSEDVGRVLASFVYSNARAGSMGLNAGQMDKAIQAIPKAQGELRDVAVGLRAYIKDPQEEGQAVRGMLFAQYLGGSVASAFVNMTQPFQVTLPWLSQYGGMKNAGAQLARALKDMGTRGFQYEPDLAKALAAAEDDGTVSPQEIHQLMAQSRGAGTLRSGDGTRVGTARAELANRWEQGKVLWGQPFALAEQFNRRSTFIAAYRTAKEQDMPNPAEFAREAVKETQFVYSKANKPRWARGAVGGTLFTFKTYSVSYLELMQRMWTQGGPEGKRAVAWSIAMLMLMGGAGGLPFAEDAEDLIDGAGQLMGYNISAKQWRKQALRDILGKELADFVEQGVSGLPGAPIDVSGRLGMGNLLPGTGLMLSKQSRERDLLEVAGPAGDLMSRGFTGARKFLTGDVAGAALEVSPTAVRNFAKGAVMAASGMYKDSKGYKVIDTTLDEALAKAMGFQPRSVAEVQEANSFMQRSKSFYQQQSAEIKAQWADALFRKDEASLQRVRARLDAWNRNNPEQRIVVKMPDVWRRVREMGKDRTQRIAETAPKALRQQMQQMASEAG